MQKSQRSRNEKRIKRQRVFHRTLAWRQKKNLNLKNKTNLEQSFQKMSSFKSLILGRFHQENSPKNCQNLDFFAESEDKKGDAK